MEGGGGVRGWSYGPEDNFNHTFLLLKSGRYVLVCRVTNLVPENAILM